MNGGTISIRAVFAIVYTTSISSIYFALGVIGGRALGLTPVVFLVAGLFFALATMTYVEGSSLHQERGGSTVFSRYAFNELVSFVSGWAILLDYAILVAVTSLTATNYLGAFWHGFAHGAVELIVTLAIIASAAVVNIRGQSPRRLQRRIAVAVADLGLQVLIVVVGLVLLFHPERLVDSIHLGSAPTWRNLIYALTVAVIAFTGLEAAASLSGEIRASRRSLKQIVGPGTALIVLIYVGISIVAVNALPVEGGHTALGGRYVDAPVLGIVQAFHPHWLANTFKYVVAVGAFASLVTAANAAMLGLSRLGYALATNRQIPSALGRLHPERGTPFVLIGLAALLAGALVAPTDLAFLIGIYAFGAMLAFTIAHASVIALRYREPKRDRPYAVPLSVPFRGGSLPLPAVLGGVLSFAGWGAVIAFHASARYAGFGWLAGGIVLYVVYRKVEGKPILKRVTIPERALRVEAMEPEFGSILVPIFGTPLDDDIVQTAGRLAGSTQDDVEAEGATIEALWVFEVPLALPLDARLPDAQLKRAREALARAKAVGEEYEGVEVATATVRARRAGQAIVDEARRRGVEAIVLAAEEPSRIRGGALLGGGGGPLENFVGDVTKYVVRKAACRVILTAPAAEAMPEAKAKAND
jgi:APA family basic amino acid/polyamine antiporter